MTQQGQRQARYRQWAGTSLTYNGDVISAGQVASGLQDLTYNVALMYILRAITGSDKTDLVGLQAEAAEFLGVPGGWDSVGSEIPVAGWDFTSGGTFPGLTYGSLFEGAVSRDSLIYRGPGEARTSSLGLLCEPQTTNKCANFNMKMVDTSGTTPDAAWTTHKVVPLETLDPEIFNALPPFTPGKLTAVYQSISNAAGQIVIDGVTGNTNPHHANGWVYVVSGDFGFSVSGTPDVTTTTGEWIRIGVNDLAPLATDQMIAGSTQASEAYWFGNQLEENEDRTSLIEVNGSAVTRLADAVSFTWPSGLSDTAFTSAVEYEIFLKPASGDITHAFEFDGGSLATPTLRLTISDTGLQRLNDAVSSFNGNSIAQNTVTRHSYGRDGGNVPWAENGVFINTYAINAATGYTDGRLGGTAPGASAVNVPLGGYVKNASLYDLVPTQAVVEQRSA